MVRPRQKKPAKKTGQRHKKLRAFLLVLALYLVYMAVGALVPFTVHPEVDAAFQSAFDPAAFTATGSPDRAALVADNAGALDTRLKIISEAQDRIIFTNFDIRDGESGRDIAAALLDAADRGVQVQLLSDGLNGLIQMEFNPMWQTLGAHPNAEIRFYNTPNLLMPWTFNGRMHDKYIIVDDRLLLTGGRNTFDKFLGNYLPDSEKSYDLEVLFYNTAAGTDGSGGSIISQVEDYFRSVWESADTKTHIDGAPLIGGAAEGEAEALRERWARWRESRPDLFAGQSDYTSVTVPLDGVTLITNPIHILSKEPMVWWQLQQLMEGAEERVYLQTPYAVCNEAMYTGLARVAAKDIPFAMQVDSTGVGDNFMASSDYTFNKQRVLDTGVTVWEWFGDYSSHGKSLLIDDDLAAVGSYNLDMRSTYIDTEMMFVIHGEAFNALLEEYLMEMEADSLQAAGVDGYVPKDGLVPWDNGDWKHVLFPVTSVLFQPFRFLL